LFKFDKIVSWPLVSPRSSKYIVISGHGQQSVIDGTINRLWWRFLSVSEVPDRKRRRRKKRRRNKKLQRSACYKRSSVRRTPSNRKMWNLKGTEERREGLEGDPEGTMPKVTWKNVVRRATKTNGLTLSVPP